METVMSSQELMRSVKARREAQGLVVDGAAFRSKTCRDWYVTRKLMRGESVEVPSDYQEVSPTEFKRHHEAWKSGVNTSVTVA